MDDTELTAMRTIYSALEPLDESARHRTLTWVADRLEIKQGSNPDSGADPDSFGTNEQDNSFSDVAELVDAAQPSGGAEYALTVAYWLQVIERREGWTGGDINSQLKNLGHGLSNVTVVLNRLMNRKPSLVMQTSKSGRSAQSRKTYKLTAAGVRQVNALLGGAGHEDN